jgi:tRNA(His) 5'-end guanylyltransferase
MAHGVNFNELPAWQKRGVPLTWEVYFKEGVDPRTDTPTKAIRRRVVAELAHPMRHQLVNRIQTLAVDDIYTKGR